MLWRVNQYANEGHGSNLLIISNMFAFASIVNHRLDVHLRGRRVRFTLISSRSVGRSVERVRPKNAVFRCVSFGSRTRTSVLNKVSCAREWTQMWTVARILDRTRVAVDEAASGDSGAWAGGRWVDSFVFSFIAYSSVTLIIRASSRLRSSRFIMPRGAIEMNRARVVRIGTI